MKKIPYIILLLFCGLIPLKAQNRTLTKDFEVWTETSLIFPVVKKKDKNGKDVEKVNFFISGTFRAGRNVSKPIDERIGAGVDFIVNKYLTLTTSYLYRAGQPVNGGKEFEHRLRFEATLNKKWEKFSIKDRNRIEYRIRHSRADSVRYRNKFTFTYPIKKEGKEIIAPFIATEPFYDFSEKEFSRNEFSVGVGRKLNKRTSADFFYMWQANRATLKNINIIGVNVKIKID